MRLRYEKTEYVNTDTGEIINGQLKFQRKHKADSVKMGTEERSMWQEGEITYVRTRREFKIIAVQKKLKL